MVNKGFLCKLVTEAIGFSKWVNWAAERKGANHPTSESLSQAEGGESASKTQPVVQTTDSLVVLSSGAGWRTELR